MLCTAMSDAPKPLSTEPPTDASAAGKGPDPVIGAGMTLLGIFIMGVAGAAQAHYAFNIGTLVACIGAVVFVLFVALSALKQRKATANGG
jgi:energy-converting hydrogenase Eha subunit A